MAHLLVVGGTLALSALKTSVANGSLYNAIASAAAGRTQPAKGNELDERLYALYFPSSLTVEECSGSRHSEKEVDYRDRLGKEKKKIIASADFKEFARNWKYIDVKPCDKLISPMEPMEFIFADVGGHESIEWLTPTVESWEGTRLLDHPKLRTDSRNFSLFRALNDVMFETRLRDVPAQCWWSPNFQAINVPHIASIKEDGTPHVEEWRTQFPCELRDFEDQKQVKPDDYIFKPQGWDGSDTILTADQLPEGYVPHNTFGLTAASDARDFRAPVLRWSDYLRLSKEHQLRMIRHHKKTFDRVTWLYRKTLNLHSHQNYSHRDEKPNGDGKHGGYHNRPERESIIRQYNLSIGRKKSAPAVDGYFSQNQRIEGTEYDEINDRQHKQPLKRKGQFTIVYQNVHDFEGELITVTFEDRMRAVQEAAAAPVSPTGVVYSPKATTPAAAAAAARPAPPSSHSSSSSSAVTKAAVVFSGPLAKQSPTFPIFQDRFFVLHPTALVYYKTQEDHASGRVQPQGRIELAQIKAVDPLETDARRFDVVIAGRTYILRGADHHSTKQWREEIEKAIEAFKVAKAAKLAAASAPAPVAVVPAETAPIAMPEPSAPVAPQTPEPAPVEVVQAPAPVQAVASSSPPPATISKEPEQLRLPNPMLGCPFENFFRTRTYWFTDEWDAEKEEFVNATLGEPAENVHVDKIFPYNYVHRYTAEALQAEGVRQQEREKWQAIDRAHAEQDRLALEAKEEVKRAAAQKILDDKAAVEQARADLAAKQEREAEERRVEAESNAAAAVAKAQERSRQVAVIQAEYQAGLSVLYLPTCTMDQAEKSAHMAMLMAQMQSKMALAMI